MTVTLILLIVLVICIAGLMLAHQNGQEQEQRERAEYEEKRDRYIAWVRAKYAVKEPHQYRVRKHNDFTGERPLGPAELRAIKMEITKQ